MIHPDVRERTSEGVKERTRTVDEMHLDVLRNAGLLLREGIFEQETPSPLPALQLSETRAYMPVLIPKNMQGFYNDDLGVTALANGGAQIMNAELFIRRRTDHLAREVMDELESSTAGFMLGFTRPQDHLVYSGNPQYFPVLDATLRRISDSFSTIGIETTRNTVAVDSVDSWIAGNRGRNLVLPNVLEPALVVDYDDTRELLQRSLIGVAVYRKDGCQQLWEREGVATPRTVYLEGGNPADITSEIGRYKEYVVNGVDGSGGFGIYFLSEALMHDHVLKTNPGELIQVQGKLPLDCAPGFVASITPFDIQPLIVSKQRFKGPGEHDGNEWYDGMGADLGKAYPDFEEVNKSALYALQAAGVVGQVSMDSLLISSEVANSYGYTHRTLMRETNPRSGGSSPLITIKEGNIDGVPIGRIHTAKSIYVPYAHATAQSFPDLLLQLGEAGRTRVVLYNYNPQTKNGSFAFVGSYDTSAEELEALQRKTVDKIEYYQY